MFHDSVCQSGRNSAFHGVGWEIHNGLIQMASWCCLPSGISDGAAGHVVFRPDSRGLLTAWLGAERGSFPRSQGEASASEATQHYFHQVLLVKISQQSQSQFKGRTKTPPLGGRSGRKRVPILNLLQKLPGGRKARNRHSEDSENSL